MVAMLKSELDLGLAESIMEALALDSSLLRGRQREMTVIGERKTER
jgi:hypothetical protein